VFVDVDIDIDIDIDIYLCYGRLFQYVVHVYVVANVD